MFNQMDAYINMHNIQAASGKYSFTLGHNQFTDLSNSERNEMLNLRGEPPHPFPRELCAPSDPKQVSIVDVPDWVDWRTKNAVTPVKNQASCGSCWTFATSGALEGSHAILTGQLLTFSEQQTLDCVSDSDPAGYDCYGCNGGWAMCAYMYYADNNQPLILEEDYKYTMV
jgi:C1A family cysteine protease